MWPIINVIFYFVTCMYIKLILIWKKEREIEYVVHLIVKLEFNRVRIFFGIYPFTLERDGYCHLAEHSWI